MAKEPDYLPKTSLVENDAPVTVKYEPVSAKSKWDKKEFKTSYEGLQTLQSGDSVAFSNLMYGDARLVENQNISSKGLINAQRNAAAFAADSLYGFAVARGVDLADTVFKIDPHMLANYSIQLGQGNLIFEGSKDMKKYNDAVKDAKSHVKTLEAIQKDADAFLEQKLKPLSDFAKSFYISLGQPLIQEFVQYHQGGIVRAMDGYGLTKFIGDNLKQADKAASKERKETEAAVKAGKKDKDLEAIAKSHDSSYQRARQASFTLLSRTYQAITAEEEAKAREEAAKKKKAA